MKKNICKNIFCFLAFLLIFFHYENISAQAVYPLGKGVPNGVEAHCFYNGKLYVVYPRTIEVIKAPDTTQNTPYILSVWNGVFWTVLDSFTLNYHYDSSLIYYTPHMSQMQFYNGVLYLGGGFDSILNLHNCRSVIKWDGKTWAGIGGPSLIKHEAYISTMAVYKNKLYIGGNFDTMPGVHTSNIATWDGSKWGVVGKAGNEGVGWIGKKDSGYVDKVLVYQDSLYVVGSFSETGGISTANIARWDGSNWYGGYVQWMYPWSINVIGFYNGEMYINGFGDPPAVLAMYKKSKTTGQWVKVGGLEETQSLVVYDGKIWCQGSGCGVYDGKNWEFVSSPGDIDDYFVPTYLDTSGANLYLIGNYYYDSNFHGNINAGIVDTTIVKIAGRVALHSCQTVPPMPNPPVKNNIVEIEPGGYYANTDDSGNYEIFLNAGQYTVSCHKPRYWVQLCPSNPVNYSFNDSKDTIHNNVDFNIDMKPNVKDLNITLVGLTGGYAAVRGITEIYRLAYANYGTEDIPSGTLYLRHPTGFQRFKALTTPDSYNSPIAKWNFTNLKVGEQRIIQFQIRTDSAINLKDTIHFYAGFDSVTNINDSNLNDNFDTLNQIIVASHDPNFKQSYPSGDISSTSTGIHYLVHFQNTGTAKASRVVVVDTLDTVLPLTDVVINSASAPYTLTIKNNVLIWAFDKINLPDSAADPVNSQGYISFSTGIKEGVGTGRIISNRAWIYFDYELPVGTNKTENKVTYFSILGIDGNDMSANSFTVFPNPVSQVINIANPTNEDQTISLYNFLGKSLETVFLPSKGITTMDVSKFAPGIYLLNSNKSSSQKIIIGR